MKYRIGIRRYLRKRKAQGVAAEIATHTTARERNVLYQLALACPDPRNAIEIGSYLGSSTVCLAAGLQEVGRGRLYCVDTWQNETMPDGQRDTLLEFVNNTAGYKETIEIVRKRSDQLVDGDLPSSLGLAFIDGDHSYDAVRGDIDRIRPWLRKDAVVAFHDIKYFPGVSKVFGECLESGFWQLLGAVDNLAWLKFLPGGVRDFGIDLDGTVAPITKKS